jgi:Zn-finger nucleic acid-binding protein
VSDRVFLADQIDVTQDYSLDQCPDCGGALADVSESPRVIQRVEIREEPLRIEEHRGHAYWRVPQERVIRLALAVIRRDGAKSDVVDVDVGLEVSSVILQIGANAIDDPLAFDLLQLEARTIIRIGDRLPWQAKVG